MKISNETKVGVLVIVALVLLILGFNFLKGKNLFTDEKHLYAIFYDLGSIEKSNEVKINGLPIGTVYDYEEMDKNLSGIVVTITLKRDVNIPRNSIATIESELLGSGYINIVRGDSREYLEDGDTLNTERASSLLGDVKAQVTPTLGKLRETMDSIKLVLSSINNIFDPEVKGNIRDVIYNLRASTHSLNRMLDPQNSDLARTFSNASSITDNLRRNNDSINATISNVRRASEKFADLDIQPTIDSLQMAINELKGTMAKMNSTDGTLGALIHDKKLYNKINDVILGAEILVDDIRLHPKRYVNISVFGRKDKTGPITSPLKKDSVPRTVQK